MMPSSAGSSRRWSVRSAGGSTNPPARDARLPDGSRVNAIIAPLSLSGPLLTVRRFDQERFDLAELVRIDTLSQDAADFLCACIQADPEHPHLGRYRHR